MQEIEIVWSNSLIAVKSNKKAGTYPIMDESDKVPTPPVDDVPSGAAPAPSPETPWPPAVDAAPVELANDSGQNAGVPPEVAQLQWNWGAFFLNWLWCLNHGLVLWGVLILVVPTLLRIVHLAPLGSLLVLAAAIYMGINGYKLGWQNRRFEGGIPQFLEVEKAWMKWGIAVFVIGVVLFIIAVIVAVAILGTAIFAGMHHGM
jgi:hypothetical protein